MWDFVPVAGVKSSGEVRWAVGSEGRIAGWLRALVLGALRDPIPTVISCTGLLGRGHEFALGASGHNLASLDVLFL